MEKKVLCPEITELHCKILGILETIFRQKMKHAC